MAQLLKNGELVEVNDSFAEQLVATRPDKFSFPKGKSSPKEQSTVEFTAEELDELEGDEIFELADELGVQYPKNIKAETLKAKILDFVDESK